MQGSGGDAYSKKIRSKYIKSEILDMLLRKWWRIIAKRSASKF